MEYNNSIWATIIPALLFVLYIYSRDKFKREPKGVVFASYLLGILGGIVLVFLYLILHISAIYDAPSTLGGHYIWEMVEGACLDQIMMLIFLYLLLRYNIFADEHTDRIVYASCIAMGVITTKNVVFCLMNSPSVLSQSVMRGMALIPIFFSCGIMLGYYCSSLKIKKIPFFSIKLPVLIIIPIFFQCFLIYIFLFFDIQYGLTGSLLFLLFLIIVSLFIYKVCANAIETSQIRDVDEKKVKSMYDISRYIKGKKDD